jgi:hypothetical protein
LRNKAVLELRRDLVDPPFPGYIDFIEPLSRLEALPQAWRDALRIARGVYLLTCARTKEQYVGKADGDDGFLGRWRDYIANGHGGNVGLLRREPSDYQVSILEIAGSAAPANDILKMEERWKKKLQSKEMGLNPLRLLQWARPRTKRSGLPELANPIRLVMGSVLGETITKKTRC